MNKTTFSINIEDIFRRYYRPLCLYALHYLHDIDSVEDIVQDCFTELWQRQNTGYTLTDTKSYLYTMVRNRCFHALKTENPVDTNINPAELEYQLADEEDYEKRSFIEARLWTAIDALPERCREALLLCKRDGLKYEEIAARQGVSVNTVKNQVSKALRTLKEGARKIYFFFFG